MTLRLATPDDAGSILAILRTTIEDSAITFYERVPSLDEMRAKIDAGTKTHPWLVIERDGVVLGHAAAGRFRSSEGTRWGTETSIGMAPEARGGGLGRLLYRALCETLVLLGFHNAYAGITLPNPASVALHERLGFTVVGTFRRTGYKLGRWHDSLWMQKQLIVTEGPPAELRVPSDLATDPELVRRFAEVTASG